MKLGKAFSDSVKEEHIVHMRPVRDGDSWWLGTGRALMFATVLFVALFILLWRLFDLTVIRGGEFRVLADNNRTRELIRHAPRGLLLDRTGKPLVSNIQQSRKVGNYTESDYRRQYLYESLSQITGYTGQLNDRELKDDYYSLRQYHSGDYIGRAGAEAVYEDTLRGRDGKELIEVNADGKILRTLGRQEEIPGEDVTLSVDATLSEVASRAFPAGEKGAIIISKPTTGEILTLYSSPAFSSNSFSLGMSQEEYEALQNNPDQPLLNRAISGVYPPGSTFKIVMGIAGLEEGVLKPDTTVTDNGTITIGPFSFSNWYFNQYGKVEGVLDIVKAFKRSNDIFFYKAGEWLGITKIAKWAHTVGVGTLLGIELPGEATGLMPDPVWKNAAFHTPADLAARSDQWYLGDTYHVSIGQGYLLVTPLQVNTWTNIIANGGLLCRPTIVTQGMGHRVKDKGNCRSLGIKKDTVDLISKGLTEACAPGGTGWPLFDFGIRKNDQGVATSSGTLEKIPVACKTGTAEFGDPKNRTHAWFTAYAPATDPEISVTVLVEGAGEGSNVAAPVAKKIFEEWFSR
jgi:penicillin-binding protein 2